MSVEGVAIGRPTWIEASAGTGKTWTLERIVVQRVEEGASLDAILVVTFTDKATREMRARIRRAIDDRFRSLDGSADLDAPARRARLRSALFDFDRATIATLHGFCRRTLREHAFLGGRALEESHEGGRELDRAIARTWLATRLEASGPLRAVLEASLEGLGAEPLVSLLLELSRERSPMLPTFSLEALEAGLAAVPRGAELAAASVELIEHAGTHPASRMRLSAALRDLDAVRERDDAETRLAGLFAWAAGDDRHDERTAPWLAARLSGHPTLGPALLAVARALTTPVPALVALALPELRRALDEGKARAQVVDFDELVLGMRRALEGVRGPELAALVRDRFRHVVVDEFQDTDPDQWAILRTLFFDCRPDRSLVLIGDPKQAIYGFRGADVHTYLRAEREVRAVGSKLRLGTSFRASPALLDALHRVLVPGVGEPPFFSRASMYEEPVRAGDPSRLVIERTRTGDVPLAPITVLSVRGDPPLRLKPARRALSRAIAEEIRALLTREVLVGAGGALRRLGASDVFVLTRSLAEGLEIAEALTRAGVPHAFFKQDGLFSTAEARDWADLLLALASPEDGARVARALATPFFGVAPEDFGALGALPHEHPLLVRFRALAALAEKSSVADLVSTLLEATGITCRELYLFSSERRLTNYLHLAEVLAELARVHHASLRELSTRLLMLTEGHTSAAEGEDVQRLPSERAAVQILTMHKAKGLEAEAVFVYGGLGRPRTSPLRRRIGTTGEEERIAWLLPRSAGTSDAAIEASIEREEREEAERLLYVAMTRARSLLYLPFFEAAAGPRPSRLRGPYQVVHERLGALSKTDALGAPHFRVEPVAPAAGGRLGARRREPLAAPEPHLVAAETSVPPPSAFEALGRERAGGVVTSYSRMKRERDRLVGSSELDVLSRFHEAPDERAAATPEDPGGTGFGVAVHRVLELVPIELARRAASAEALLAHPEVSQLALESLLENGLDERALPLLGQLVHGGLETQIAELGHGVRLVDPPRRATEVPFVHVLPEVGHVAASAKIARDAAPLVPRRGYLRGVLDLVIEVDGRLWVLDWKTDRLATYEARSIAAHVEESYAIQLRLYALALRRMLATEPGSAVDTRLGGVAFVFLRGRVGAASGGEGPLLDRARGGDDGLFVAQPSSAELDRWDAELRRSDTPFGYPLGTPSAQAGQLRRGASLGPRLDAREVG